MSDLLPDARHPAGRPVARPVVFRQVSAAPLAPPAQRAGGEAQAADPPQHREHAPRVSTPSAGQRVVRPPNGASLSGRGQAHASAAGRVSSRAHAGLARGQARAPAASARGQLRAPSLLSASLTLMAAFLASRLLGLIRQSALAYRFDDGAAASAFFAAFRIPDLLFALVVGGALNSAFIPIFAGLLEQGEEDAAWRLATTILNSVVLALALLGGLAALFAPALAPLLAPGFDPATQQLVGELSRVLFLQPLFFGVGAVAFAVLNARQHFLLPAWAPAVYNLFQIAALVLLTPHMGIMGLAVGVVAGAVAYAAMQVPALRRHGFRYARRLDWRQPEARRVLRLLAPRTLTLASNQIGHTITTTVLASTLVGGVAALSYAYTLLLLPVGILGVSVATAAFPTLAQLASSRQYDQLRATLRASFRALLYYGVAAGAVLLALRTAVVSVLYRHGNFSPSDTALVAWPLAFYAIGLAAQLADELLPRAFFALQDTRTPLFINLAAVLANIGLSLLLLRPLGLGGIAAALTIAAVLEMTLYLVVLERRLPGLVGAALGRDLRGLLFAGLVACLVATLISALLRGGAAAPFGRNLIVLILGGGAGSLAFAAVAARLGFTEHQRVFAVLGKVRGRLGARPT